MKSAFNAAPAKRSRSTAAADRLDLRSVQPFQLLIFATAAQCGSFSEAARRLNLTQPAVSQTVRRLEEVFGLALFDRSAKPPALTAKGREFLLLARELTAQAAHFLEAVENLREDAVRTLRFGITESAALFASVELEAFLMRQTKTFEARWGLIPKILADFTGGRLDIVVAPDISAQERALAFPLLSERYLLVCPQSESLAEDLQPLERLREALQQPFITYRTDSMDWRKSLSMLRIMGVTVQKQIALENTQAVAGAVLRGLGWTILPPMSLWSIRSDLHAVTVHGIDNSIEKTLWCAARTPRFRMLAQSAAEIFRRKLTEIWLPELLRAKPALEGFVRPASGQ